MSTPAPEAIEAAEAGMYQRMTWASLHWNALDPDQQRELATAALTAAYPIIAAQAKAEALREAADEFGSWGPTGIAAANALRNRAATIEGKNE